MASAEEVNWAKEALEKAVNNWLKIQEGIIVEPEDSEED